MKSKLFLLFLLLTLNIKANEFSIGNFSRGDLEVKMGELTGAGSRFALSEVAGFVHPKGYIMKEDCTNIFLRNASNPKVSDILKIEIDGLVIPAKEITGILIEKK